MEPKSLERLWGICCLSRTEKQQIPRAAKTTPLDIRKVAAALGMTVVKKFRSAQDFTRSLFSLVYFCSDSCQTIRPIPYGTGPYASVNRNVFKFCGVGA